MIGSYFSTPPLCSPRARGRWAASLLVLAGAALPLTAQARESTASELEAAEPSSPQVTPRPKLYSVVTIAGFELAPERISEALADELQVGLTQDSGAAALTLRVEAEAGKTVTVTYVPASGTPISRSVTAPGRADELPEVAALLAGNLARDESEQLLVDLAKARAAAADEARLAAEQAAKTEASKAEPKPEPQVKAKPEIAPANKEPELQDTLVNLSFFHPLALYPTATERRFNLELGLFYGHVGGIEGVGIDFTVLHVDRTATGALIGGLVTLHGGGLEGASIAGFANVGWGKSVRGAQIGGLVSYSGADDFEGAQVGGSLALAPGKSTGTQLAGLATFNGGPLTGAQIGGGVSIAGSQITGVQLAGGISYAQDVEGAQIASLVNVAPDGVNGVQLGDVNIAGKVEGAQIGLINVGGDVEGLQFGLVNVARSVKGASVGLVTYSKEGKTQLVAWTSSNEPMNLGARFYTGPLYAMPSVGYDPAHSNRFEPGVSLGARVELGRFYVDLDGQYSQRVKSETDANFMRLRYRALLGFAITPWVAVFAGGGVKHDVQTGADSSQSYGPDLAAGVELF